MMVAARTTGTLLVAVPGVGLGVATLWQAASEGGALSQNQLFHLGLGLALLILFSEFTVTISRAGTLSGALARAAAGFAGCLAAAIAVELFGPVALLVLVAVTASWATWIAVSRRNARSRGLGPSAV
jgi:hypothetical protein